MRRFAVYVVPILGWAALIFLLSAQSQLPTVRVSHFDKLAHALVYGVLAALICRALLGYGGKPPSSLLLGLALASAYGGTDELHQYFTPGRSADVRDWLADTVGATLGALLAVRLLTRGEHLKATP